MQISLLLYGVTEKAIQLARYIIVNGGTIESFIDKRADEIGVVEIEGFQIPCINLDKEMAFENSLVIVCNNLFMQSYYSLREYGFERIYSLQDLEDDKSFFVPPHKDCCDFDLAQPFNNYESPYPDLDIVRKNYPQRVNKSKIMDIDCNLKGQIQLLRQFADLPNPVWSKDNCEEYKYNYPNDWFLIGGAVAIHYMMNLYKPHRIIEIGSGYSTRAMMDVNTMFFNDEIEINCVEPRPYRLKEYIGHSNVNLIEKDLQDVSLELFDGLQENDILFIDSSHVCKPESDVSLEIFEILPRLKSGVVIHFHDVFWPFEYPFEWVKQGRAYNEMFLLRAFLMNNKDYEILLFGDMLNKSEVAIRELGDMGDFVCGEGSLWIRKK